MCRTLCLKFSYYYFVILCLYVYVYTPLCWVKYVVIALHVISLIHILLVLFLTCPVIAIINSAEIGVHAAASCKLNRDIPPIHLHTFIDEMYSTGRPCTAKCIFITPFHAQTSGV